MAELLEAYRRAIKAGRAGSYRFVSLVGLRSQDPLDIRRRVEEGLSFAALESFQRNTGLSTADLADAVMITMRTLHRRKDQGRLEPEESDRLLRLSRVFGRALELFEGDAPAAREWLARPHKALGGERPMNLAKTDVGAREVEALAERLDHGVLA
jgi:putative toxin-antitoxin system antitoxin component (TIGR02293 family)